MRILLSVAYDGSGYAGWQRQDNATTVQEMLERALGDIFGGKIGVTGASRTDAGVHALGQRAAFTVPELKIPPDKLPYVINNALPPDIAVTLAEAVSDAFHPRFDAVEKTYRYMYHCAGFPNPLIRNAWFVPLRLYPRDPSGFCRCGICSRGLDVEKMNAAARDFVGAHDFAAFCAAGSETKTTIREIYECRVERVASAPNRHTTVAGDDGAEYRADRQPFPQKTAASDWDSSDTECADTECMDTLIALFVRGNGFLYNMVRIMAGTLLYVGEKKLPEDCVPGIIESKDRTKAGMTAPPGGLTLMEVRY